MQRRLDLAASLVGYPKVLFLDEPTIGLDPRSRIGMWEVIRDLVSGGTTLLLTTEYLEEADEPADEIVAIDHALVIAAGTSDELKDRVGGDVLEFTVPNPAKQRAAAGAVSNLSDRDPAIDPATGQVSIRIGRRGSESLVQAVRRLDSEGVAIQGLHRPLLDDVFLAVTGRTTQEENSGDIPDTERRGTIPATQEDRP